MNESSSQDTGPERPANAEPTPVSNSVSTPVSSSVSSHEPGRAPLPADLSPRAATPARGRFGWYRSRRAGQPRRPWTRRQRVLRTITVLGVVILLAFGAVVGYGVYLNSEIHRITVAPLIPGKTATGKLQNTENILLVGSTSRCALKVQSKAYGLCQEGVDGVNSDVVMILHLNPNTKSLSILSLPRDVFVPNARAEGANKIDAALVEGPSQLVTAVQDDFGIAINHYVELNFDTFAGVVNALGGVKMYFPEPVYDSYSGLNVPVAGCLMLNGVRALQVVRARHLQYKAPGVTTTDPALWPQETLSDLARIRRDHEFLRVLGSKVASKGIDNPLTDQRIVAAVAPQLEVDSGLSALDLVHLMVTFHSVNPDTAPQLTIPVAVTTFGGYEYKGGNYGDVEFPTEPQDLSVIDSFLGIDASTDPLTGAALPAASAVSVNVLNGSGVAGQATSTGHALSALGFHVTSVGDTASVGKYAETVVNYATAAQEPAAQAVLRSLSGYAILARNPAAVTAGSTVTVDTGTSFTVARPSVATTPLSTATTKPPSTPVTTPASTPAVSAPASVPAGFDPASSSAQALAAWDPRSCTATGGPGA